MAHPPASPWLDPILAAAADLRIAVFGDFALDAYWSLDPDTSQLSVETGLPVRRVRSQRYSLGGAANVAANLKALGVGEVRALGLRGDDPFGRELDRLLRAAGIDTRGLAADQPDWQTAVFAKPHETGSGSDPVESNRIDFGTDNALTQAGFDRLQSDLLRSAADCQAIVVNQQIAAGLVPSPVVAWLNQQIRAFPDCRFVVDSRDRPHEFDGAALKLNESEARAMQHDLDSPCEALVAQVRDRVEAPACITRGPRGLVTADAAGVTAIDGIPVPEPNDPVGAGDTVVAGLAIALAGGFDAAAAGRFANLAAAVTVAQRFRTGTASPADLRALADAQGIL